MLKTKTTATNRLWNLNLRIRVGDSVNHIDRTWVNKTGTNTEPGFNSVNWDVVGQADTALFKPFVEVNGHLFMLDKHPANSDPLLFNVIEHNDMIIDGWWDNVEYWGKAMFIGVDIDVKADWEILDGIEEIVLI